jgi:hypothetical protein
MRLSFAGLLALRAVGCVLISDNALVNELRECRVGSTESRLGFSHEDAIPVYCTRMFSSNIEIQTAFVAVTLAQKRGVCHGKWIPLSYWTNRVNKKLQLTSRITPRKLLKTLEVLSSINRIYAADEVSQ